MFINNVFEQIKDNADIMQVANHYSLQFNRNGFTNCPFHNEKTPSMSIDPRRRIFKCFGCGKGGDVITLVEGLEKCTPYEAAKIINRICNCGIEFDKDKEIPEFNYDKEFAKMKFKKQKENEKEQEKEEALVNLRDLAYQIFRYWRNMCINLQEYTIDSFGDELAIIYKNKDYFELLIDLFENNKDYVYGKKDIIEEILERGIIFMDFDKISEAAYREEEMPKGSTNIELIAYYRLKDIYLKHYKNQLTEEQGIKEKQKVRADYDSQNKLKTFNDDIIKKLSNNIIKSENEVTKLNHMIIEKKPEKEMLDVAISCIANLIDNDMLLKNYQENY